MALELLMAGGGLVRIQMRRLTVFMLRRISRPLKVACCSQIATTSPRRLGSSHSMGWIATLGNVIRSVERGPTTSLKLDTSITFPTWQQRLASRNSKSYRNFRHDEITLLAYT